MVYPLTRGTLAQASIPGIGVTRGLLRVLRLYIAAVDNHHRRHGSQKRGALRFGEREQGYWQLWTTRSARLDGWHDMP